MVLSGTPLIVRERLRSCCLALFAPLLGACSGTAAISIDTWTLDHEGQQSQVVLPTHFHDRLPARRSGYTLRALAPIPAAWRGQALTLSIPAFPAIAELSVAGQRVEPVESWTYAVVRDGPRVWPISAEATQSAELLLELNVRYLWSAAAWFDSVPRLSRNPRGDSQTQLVRSFNRWAFGLGIGILGTISFTYLILFLFDRSDRMYGWLAVQTALPIYYLLYQLGPTQVPTGWADTPLMGLTISISVLAGIRAVHARFDLGPVPRGWWAALAANVVGAAFWARPFFSVTPFSHMVVATLAAGGAYVLYKLVQVARLRLDDDATTDLAGWTALLASAAPGDCAFWLGAGEPLGGIRLVAIGLSIFSLLQFVTLARALMHQQTAIANLNQELQRQAHERSQQLEAALMRLNSEAARADALNLQEIIEGRYRVLAEVGAGASGVVYKVERLNDHAPFAMKVLRHATMTSMARLAREAHLLSKIHHPNIVSIADVGFSTTGFMFIVLEYVAGQSLDSRRERFGEAEWALPILSGVASGLAAIHSYGVIHRDLKPANILLASDALPKLSDFGISGLHTFGAGVAVDDSTQTDEPALADGATERVSAVWTFDSALVSLLDRPERSVNETLTAIGLAPRPVGPDRQDLLTQHHAVMGTPRYMAPETVRGASYSSTAADMFSFGVVCYEMLTGKSPFAVAPAVALLRGQRPRRAAPLGAHGKALSPALVALVDRCLTFNPGLRPTANDLAEAFASQR
jgi:serine/threonine protein kinase